MRDVSQQQHSLKSRGQAVGGEFGRRQATELIEGDNVMLDNPEQLVGVCRRRGIVVMAGAGVSASAPSSLPGWYPLNEAIFDAICDRVENFLESPDYTAHIRPAIGTTIQKLIIRHPM